MSISNDTSKGATGPATVQGRQKYPFVKMPYWLLDSGVSAGALHLFCVLARYADYGTGELFAGQARMAKNLSCTDRTVRTYMTELKVVNAVAVVRRRWNNSSITVIAIDAPLLPSEVEALVNDSPEAEFRTTPEADFRTTPEADFHLTRTSNLEPDKLEPALTIAPLERNVEEPPSETFQEELLPSVVPQKKQRATDEVWESLIEACQINPAEITSGARGGYNRAAKELRDVGATPALIRSKAAAYRISMPKATLTPSALAKHWAGLEGYVDSPTVSKNASSLVRAAMKYKSDDNQGELQ